MEKLKKQSISYLDEKGVRRLTWKQKRRKIIGACLVGFFGLASILSLVDYVPGLRENLPVYVGFLIPSVLLLLLGLRAGQDLELARRYNSIFSNDQDGVVEFSELRKATGQEAGQISKDLERLFRLGLFQGCTLRQENVPSVVLANADEDGAGFVVVTCTHCGAPTRIRAGSSGKCEYCGGRIRG